MKRYEGDYYKARMTKGSGYLSFNCNGKERKLDTISDVREAIDKSRKREVEKGYKPTQYIITHYEWYRWFDDDGNFVKEETYEQAIETYPILNA